MSLLDRYIFKQIITIFVSVLIILSLIIWMTQALKELDIITAQGQAIGIFFFMTFLSLPLLILVVAPVALMVAFLIVLNRLNADSELIVLNASGLSPASLIKPFALSAVIAAMLIGVMSLYLSPLAQNLLRFTITQVRADLISTIIKDNSFTQLEEGLTFHIRSRAPGGILYGIMVSDRREEKTEITYLAEQGKIVEVQENTFLIMQKGSIQQKPLKSKNTQQLADITHVKFEQYALDLSRFNQEAEVNFFKPRERSTLYLLNPDEKDTFFETKPGQFKAELHDRLSAPLYALSFMAMTLALMGQARTTRQSRGMSVLLTIIAALSTRLLGFASLSLSIKYPFMAFFIYAFPLSTFFIGLYIFITQKRITMPTMLSSFIIQKIRQIQKRLHRKNARTSAAQHHKRDRR